MKVRGTAARAWMMSLEMMDTTREFQKDKHAPTMLVRLLFLCYTELGSFQFDNTFRDWSQQAVYCCKGIDGKPETVHVKNTGRLRELLVPNAKITLQRVDEDDRKTAYDLISVYKPRLKWVNIDSLAPNELMKQQLLSMNYDLVKPEYKYGDSRFDFYMERDGQKYLTEVKGCTLAADIKTGIGLFPDAPTERGVKHLCELAVYGMEKYLGRSWCWSGPKRPCLTQSATSQYQRGIRC